MMKQYFTKKFLFEINRIQIEAWDKAFLAIGVLLLVVAVLFKLASVWAPTPIDAKYRRKFFHLFLSIGSTEAIWFGFRSQYVNFFGSHFVAMLVLLIGIIWFGFLLWGMLNKYKSEKQEWEKEQTKLKYLQK